MVVLAKKGKGSQRENRGHGAPKKKSGEHRVGQQGGKQSDRRSPKKPRKG